MMAQPPETPLKISEGARAVSRDRELRYWLGRVADGVFAHPGMRREKKEFDARLADTMATVHGVTAEEVRTGILIAEYRRAEAGLASGN